MTKYEYVVTSCTNRDIALVGKFYNESDAFKAMIRDFVVFHNEMNALKDLYEAIKHMELPDKEYTIDKVVDAILSLLKTGGCDEIQESPDTMSIYAFGITARACWSNLNNRDADYNCKISLVEQKEPELIVDATVKSKEKNMTFFIGKESASGIFCDAWDEFVAHLYNAYLARMRNGETQFNVTIESSIETQKTKRVVVFDEFARVCKYFDPTTNVNNGYGCNHPAQEEREARFEVTMTSDAFPNPEDAFAIWDKIREEYYADTFGRVWTYPTEKKAQKGLLKVEEIEGSTGSCGCCFCHSCPLGIEAEQCDKDDPEYAEKVDWDGFCDDGQVCEGEYLLIDCGDEATDDQKDALERWEAYQHQYDVKK